MDREKLFSKYKSKLIYEIITHFKMNDALTQEEFNLLYNDNNIAYKNNLKLFNLE